MLLLPDSEDDALLQEGQVAEERIGSVDYDVWNCPSCSHHFTLRYPKWVSQVRKVPAVFESHEIVEGARD